MLILIGVIVWIVSNFIILLGNITLNDTVELIGIFGALSGFLLVIMVIIYCFI